MYCSKLPDQARDAPDLPSLCSMGLDVLSATASRLGVVKIRHKLLETGKAGLGLPDSRCALTEKQFISCRVRWSN